MKCSKLMSGSYTQSKVYSQVPLPPRLPKVGFQSFLKTVLFICSMQINKQQSSF